MRILITGGTGYIGSRLCRLLADSGRHELFSLQRPGHRPVDGVTAIEWDLARPIDVSVLPGAIDAVAHLAVARNFRLFPEGVPDLFAVNVRTTVELLDYARGAGASHFFMASTGNGNAPDLGLAVGDTPTPPNDFYTASKLAGEALVRPYRSCFPVNVMRAYFPYGPGQDAKTVQRMIAAVKAGKPVVLAPGRDGEGDTLSLVYIDDLTRTIVRSMTEGWDGLLDVAAPERLSVRQIADEIGRQLDIEPCFSTGGLEAKDMTADLTPLRERDPVDFLTFSQGLSALLAEEAAGPS